MRTCFPQLFTSIYFVLFWWFLIIATVTGMRCYHKFWFTCLWSLKIMGIHSCSCNLHFLRNVFNNLPIFKLDDLVVLSMRYLLISLNILMLKPSSDKRWQTLLPLCWTFPAKLLCLTLCWFEWEVSPGSHVFDHLVPDWWCCLRRVRNPKEVPPYWKRCVSRGWALRGHSPGLLSLIFLFLTPCLPVQVELLSLWKCKPSQTLSSRSKSLLATGTYPCMC